MHPCFVCGVARSGTSLLKGLLDGHPQVMLLPGESFAADWHDAADPVAGFLAGSNFTKFFEPGSGIYLALEQKLRARLTGPTDLRGALIALYEAGAELWPPPPGSRVWVEKTPRHLRVLPALLSTFGDRARGVVVVRDPRGTMSSQQKRWSRGGAAAVRTFARRWATADRLVAQYQAELPAALVVRYEDLVLDTEPHMRRIADALGLDWDPILVTPTRGGEPWGGNSSFGDKAAGISDHSLRRWEQSLDPADVALLESLLGKRMAAWGYELSTDAGGGGLRRLAMEANAARHARRERKRARGLGRG